MTTEPGALGFTCDINVISPLGTGNTTFTPAIVIGAGVGAITLDARNQQAGYTITHPFTTGYTEGIFIGPDEIQANLTSYRTVRVYEQTIGFQAIKDGAQTEFNVTRTGSGAAVGVLAAVANHIQTGSRSNNIYALIQDDVERVLIKSNTVNIQSLPTAAAGLSAGDLWNNAGVLHII
jgi:hypothetical protein